MTTDHRSPTIWLALPSGAHVAHHVAIGSCVVGRDGDVSVSIPSDLVSRRHAELSWDGERLRLRDLGSRNGTTVNGRPVEGWVDLADGDVIRFAGVEGVVQSGVTGEVPRDGGVEPVYEQSVYEEQSVSEQGRSRQPRREPGPARRTQDLPLSQVPVFVSHSSQDKTTARAISRYLEGRGWRVWIDEAGIAGGKEWHSELIRALESTWVVLLMVSIHSMRSRWVIREVQAADRLGLRIIPVIVDDAPYPDELRMILSGVQQLYLTEQNDVARFNQQLSRLDEALILAARAGRRSEPGRFLIAMGSIIRAVGLVGVILGFALFAYLGFAEFSDPSFGEGIPRPFIGWSVFAVSLVVAGSGEAMRRAGLKKGI